MSLPKPLLFLISLLLAQASWSQDGLRFKFGLNGSTSSFKSEVTDEYEINPAICLQGGFAYSKTINKRFVFQYDVLYSSKGFNAQKISTNEDYSYRENYFTITPSLGLKLGKQLQFHLGIQYGKMVMHKYSFGTSASGGGGNMFVLYNGDSDWAATSELIYTIPKIFNNDLSISLRYELGLAPRYVRVSEPTNELFKESFDYIFRNGRLRNLQFSLHYYLF